MVISLGHSIIILVTEFMESHKSLFFSFAGVLGKGSPMGSLGKREEAANGD